MELYRHHSNDSYLDQTTQLGYDPAICSGCLFHCGWLFFLAVIKLCISWWSSQYIYSRIRGLHHIRNIAANKCSWSHNIRIPQKLWTNKNTYITYQARLYKYSFYFYPVHTHLMCMYCMKGILCVYVIPSGRHPLGSQWSGPTCGPPSGCWLPLGCLPDHVV